MGKNDWKNKNKAEQSSETPQQDVAAPSEMTMEESRAYRASLHKPEHREMSQDEKRNQFRIWWAEQKYRFGMGKEMESILWMHLKAINHMNPEQFEAGMKNFGLKSK